MGRRRELEAVVRTVPAASTVVLALKPSAPNVPRDGLLQRRSLSRNQTALCVSMLSATSVVTSAVGIQFQPREHVGRVTLK